MTASKGPKPRVYVNAIICADVIKEAETDQLTALRLTDAFVAYPAAKLTPRDAEGTHLESEERMLYRDIQFKVIINFTSDDPCEFDVMFRSVSPSQTEKHKTFKSSTQGPEGGSTLCVNATASGQNSGLYWFEIYVDGELSTKLPFRVFHPDQMSRIAVPKDTSEEL